MPTTTLVTQTSQKPFSEDWGAREGCFFTTNDITGGGVASVSPVAAGETKDIYVPASARSIYVLNSSLSTGAGTITQYDSAGTVRAGSFVLGPGDFITLPLGGAGDVSNRYPNRVRIVAAAATTVSYMWECNQPSGLSA